jgi:hypothetical protein
MATTTNYGWDTPDDTDLVKDGAAAIRTLGSSVDTTVKALNPGTTSGDLDYYTASTTKARIAKGTAGQVFTMNSGATAPEWQTLNAGGMTLISTTTLTGASVTLSSIPQTFVDLYVVVQKYCPANNAEPMQSRFNGDATASRHSNGGWTSAPSFGNAQWNPWTATQTNTAANCTQMVVIEYPNYTNTTTWKQAYSLGWGLDSNNTTQQIIAQRGFYNQTAAISSLSFFPGSGNFTSGTILLYGVK